METARLSIRRFENTDFAAFAALIRDKMSDPNHIYDHPFPTDDESLRDILCYFAETDGFYAVFKKTDADLTGFIALNREEDPDVRNLGFYMHTASRAEGYAFEAAERMIRFAEEELGVRRLVSGTAGENTAAVRLLRKLGFILLEETPGVNPFAADAEGNPMILTVCSFERLLDQDVQ